MELEIVLLSNFTEGKLVASYESENVGSISYTLNGIKNVDINDLTIKEGYEKQNIEIKLVDALVELVRNNRKIINPKNSFANLLLEMNDEYKDVLSVAKIKQVLA